MIGDYYRNVTLNLWAGVNRASLMPPVFYLGLTTTPTTSSDFGDEPDPLDGYMRVPIFNDGTNWGPAVSGLKSNLQIIEFSAATNPWGTIIGWFLADQGTIGFGNVVTAAAVTPQPILKNHAPFFAPGSLVLQAV